MLEEMNGIQWNMADEYLKMIAETLREVKQAQVTRKTLLAQRYLYELYKLIYPKLDQKERDVAQKKWATITNFGTKPSKEGGVNYDPKVVYFLDEFDFWLRDRLESHELLMPKNKFDVDEYLE